MQDQLLPVPLPFAFPHGPVLFVWDVGRHWLAYGFVECLGRHTTLIELGPSLGGVSEVTAVDFHAPDGLEPFAIWKAQ